MECQGLGEYYEAFAVGALEGEERTELQAHLARGCPVCTPEVEKARWVVSQLAYLAPQVAPPARVRRRLLDSIQERVAPRPWLPVWAWATAAVVLLGATVFAAWQAGNLRHQVEELQARSERVAAEAEAHRHALAILSAPETRAFILAASETTLPAVRAYWNESLGLVLTGPELPALSSERNYQLWVVPKQGNPISAGVFQPDAGGTVLLLSTPEATLAESAALAITEEPAGGSPQPTTTPIWVASVGS